MTFTQIGLSMDIIGFLLIAPALGVIGEGIPFWEPIKWSQSWWLRLTGIALVVLGFIFQLWDTFSTGPVATLEGLRRCIACSPSSPSSPKQKSPACGHTRAPTARSTTAQKPFSTLRSLPSISSMWLSSTISGGESRTTSPVILTIIPAS